MTANFKNFTRHFPPVKKIKKGKTLCILLNGCIALYEYTGFKNEVEVYAYCKLGADPP